MTIEFLSYFWYFALALVWAIYVVQEAFVTGGSMLSFFYRNDDKTYKEIYNINGLHWDGIQVWLILAVGGTFAAFPVVYATMLSNLYIPFFLLLFAIIYRGVAIEVVYKTDSEKFRTILRYVLSITSFLIILVVGIYLMINFIGLPMESENFNTEVFSFLVIFSRDAILCGLLFVVFALMQGFNFLNIYSNKLDLSKVYKYLKWISLLLPLLVVSIFLSFSNATDVFARGLFYEYPVLFVLPLVCVLCAVLSFIAFFYKKVVLSFITGIFTMIAFIFTGYISMIPFFVVSSTNEEYGITIMEGAAGYNTLMIMFICTIVILPIVIIYQTFKYVKFWRKV